MDAKLTFDADRLRGMVERANEKAMYRAAGFLQKVAQRKIRYRRRTASSPGQPPFQHARGTQSFRHSIQFAVEDHGVAAVIGPTRTPNGTTNAFGGTVPNTLEFGGKTKRTTAPAWYRSDVDVPKAGLDSQPAIASWLYHEGDGPLFMASTEAGVVNQILRSEGEARMSRREIASRRRADPTGRLFRYIMSRKVRGKDGRTRKVYWAAFTIRTPHQAIKASKNIVEYFGLPTVKAFDIQARPFMGPTFREKLSDLSAFWRDRLAHA